jgi:hypothetical protein
MEAEGWNGKELAITAALQRGKEPGDKSRSKAKRVTRERKIRTSTGIMVTLKARKLLKDEQAEAGVAGSPGGVGAGGRRRCSSWCQGKGIVPSG